MLREQNVIPATYPAYEIVKPFLLTEDGLKVQEYLATLDLVDFVFNENGYDRLQSGCPNHSIYNSIVTHFAFYAADYIDIESYCAELNKTMPQLAPEDAGEITEALFTNRKAVEYLFLLLNRQDVINGTLIKLTQVNAKL